MKAYIGKIISCDEAASTWGVLVEDGGKIAYVGQSLPDRYSMAEKVDLGTKSLCPAMADTHIHFMSHALFSGGLNLRGSKTIADEIAAVRRFVEGDPGRIAIGFGSSANSVAERRLLTRSDLDQASPDKPVFIVKYDGHAAIVNQALIDALPKTMSTSRGYDADSGLMTQEAFFRATDYVTGSVSLPRTLSNMLRAIDSMAAKGIGLVHSVCGVGFPGDMDVNMESLFAKGLRNQIAFRLFFQTMDVVKAKKRGLPRIGGCFVTALDGCYGSEDAALLKPYANNPENLGVLYYDDSVVKDFCVRANRAGLQIELHAIGDRAFDQAVRAMAAALEDFPRTDHRHTIIHACLPTMDGLETCARLGIGIAVQPSFLQWEEEPLDYIEGILGDRAYHISPLATMRKMGIRLCGGSDAPCTDPDPIHGIWAAANHYVERESLSVQDALNLYTIEAARASFDEADRGSLEIGKRADFCVLSEDILSVAPKELRRVKVEGLILGGQAYKSGQGRASVLARGLFSGRKI